MTSNCAFVSNICQRGLHFVTSLFVRVCDLFVYHWCAGTASITSLANVINATGGQAVKLPCTGKGHPLPLTAHWSKSGISIPFDNRHTVSENKTLTIFGVQKGDEGTYRCRVVNGANKEDESFIEVVVYGECECDFASGVACNLVNWREVEGCLQLLSELAGRIGQSANAVREFRLKAVSSQSATALKG